MPAGWVTAGAAAIGAGESIAGNQAAAGAQKANNANNAIVSGAQNTMLGQAEGIANTPFTPYSGTMAAPLSSNEQQGVSLASSTAAGGVAQGDVAQGTSLLASEQPWSAATEAKYASPYTNAVEQAALANQNQSYLKSLSGLQAGEGGTDSFGNARNAIAEADLTSQNNLNVGTLTANLNQQAYDSAIQTWQADNQMKTAAANAYMNAGNDITQMTSDQISDLMKTGGVQQVTAQTGLTDAYNEFLRQQGWSANQLGSLISAVSASKGGPQAAPVQSNIGNQLLGLGSTLAGLWGGGSSTSSYASGAGSVDSQLGGWESSTNNAIANQPIAGLGDINIGTQAT